MSETSILFQIFLTVHILGIALGMGSALVADFSFFRTIRQGDQISAETVVWMRSFSSAVWIGLLLMFISGLAMFFTDTDKYLHSIGYIFKMILIVILMINGLFLNCYSTAKLTTFNFSQKYTRRDASWKARKLSFIFGAISSTTWLSIVMVAMFKSVIDFAMWQYIAIYIVLLSIAICGSLTLEIILFMRSRLRPPNDDLNSIPLSRLANYSSQTYTQQMQSKYNSANSKLSK